LAKANIAMVSIGQMAAQKGQSQTVATELLAGAPQFLFVSFNAQRSEQLCPGLAGELFELTARGRGALEIGNIGDLYSCGNDTKPPIEGSKFS
jgi:hypothetical protein